MIAIVTARTEGLRHRLIRCSQDLKGDFVTKTAHTMSMQTKEVYLQQVLGYLTNRSSLVSRTFLILPPRTSTTARTNPLDDPITMHPHRKIRSSIIFPSSRLNISFVLLFVAARIVVVGTNGTRNDPRSSSAQWLNLATKVQRGEWSKLFLIRCLCGRGRGLPSQRCRGDEEAAWWGCRGFGEEFLDEKCRNDSLLNRDARVSEADEDEELSSAVRRGRGGKSTKEGDDLDDG